MAGRGHTALTFRARQFWFLHLLPGCMNSSQNPRTNSSICTANPTRPPLHCSWRWGQKRRVVGGEYRSLGATCLGLLDLILELGSRVSLLSGVCVQHYALLGRGLDRMEGRSRPHPLQS